MITKADIENWFSYHAPTPEDVEVYGAIRSQAMQLASVIVKFTKQGPDQEQALASLRDTVMWANASRACNGGPTKRPEPVTLPPPDERPICPGCNKRITGEWCLTMGCPARPRIA